MGGEYQIDLEPGEVIHWFVGHGPGEVLGPCSHVCRHNSTANIAWGPDADHYTLDECHVPDGCDRRCRAWVPVDVVNGKPAPRWRECRWMEVSPDAAKVRVREAVRPIQTDP